MVVVVMVMVLLVVVTGDVGTRSSVVCMGTPRYITP